MLATDISSGGGESSWWWFALMRTTGCDGSGQECSVVWSSGQSARRLNRWSDFREQDPGTSTVRAGARAGAHPSYR